MQCHMTNLIAFLEAESDLELQTLEVTEPLCIDIRNKKLFPFLKEHTIVDDEAGY